PTADDASASHGERNRLPQRGSGFSWGSVSSPAALPESAASSPRTCVGRYLHSLYRPRADRPSRVPHTRVARGRHAKLRSQNSLADATGTVAGVVGCFLEPGVLRHCYSNSGWCGAAATARVASAATTGVALYWKGRRSEPSSFTHTR